MLRPSSMMSRSFQLSCLLVKIYDGMFECKRLHSNWCLCGVCDFFIQSGAKGVTNEFCIVFLLKVLAGRLVRQIACASAFAAVAQLLCTSGSIVLGVQLGHHRRRTEKPDVGWLLETTACLLHSAAIENRYFHIRCVDLAKIFCHVGIFQLILFTSISISVTCICTSRKAQKASQWTSIVELCVIRRRLVAFR
ncbi:Bowman-Birk type proteinase inhibitor [Trichinella spiralis]|uniref:Bowman-Birk type proteinase inhibitor n=1 Tax=Trichinella spiralis TaxID=6334 RepID=A0ABR3KI23_TRISP